MTIRKTLLASATLALVTIAGAAASAAPVHAAMHPSLQNSAAISIQYRAPDPRDFRNDGNFLDNRDFRNDRDDRFGRRIVSDRVILANLRAANLRAVSNPRFVRGRLVVQAMGRFGRIMTVEFNPYTGRMIGVIRL